MRQKEMRRAVELALRNAEKDVAASRDDHDTTNGYEGGYRDALKDCLALLSGWHPTRRQWGAIYGSLEKKSRI